jgi:hypothetical protein
MPDDSDVIDGAEPVWTFLDHGAVRRTLESVGSKTAPFSILGALSTRADIEKRARATYAPGTRIEVRVEDGGRVISRRQMRVGR